MKKCVLVLCILGLCLFSACGKNKAVVSAENAISAIGEVSLDSVELIDYAKEECAQLTEKELKKVDNMQELIDAEEQLKKLYSGIVLAEEAISKIGVVTLDSSNVISNARKTCDQLTAKELEKVSNLSILVDAEERYTMLFEEYYLGVYDTQIMKMLDSACIAEELCNITLAVWHDSIWKKDNKNTKAYTKNEKGKFYEDFNDALYALNNSDEYKDKVKQILEFDNDIEKMNEVIKNPPEKYKGNMLDAYIDYYLQYQEYIDFTLYYNETYNSFCERFDQLEKKSIEAYRKANFYVSK